MIFIDRNNEVIFMNERFEKDVSRACQEHTIDDNIKLELLKRIHNVVNSDFLYELRDNLTDEVFDSIEDEDSNQEESPLKGKVSWDAIYRIVDEFIILDWAHYK